MLFINKTTVTANRRLKIILFRPGRASSRFDFLRCCVSGSGEERGLFPEHRLVIEPRARRVVKKKKKKTVRLTKKNATKS